MTGRTVRLLAVRSALRRLVDAALVLGLAVFVAFILTRLIPGDPLSMMLESQSADPGAIREMQAENGFDQPLWRQFIDYLVGLLHGDLGWSWRYGGTPVASLIAEAAPVTLALVAVSMTIAVPAGIAAGLASVYRPGSWLDGAITAGSVLALSLPAVVLATWLMVAATVFWDLPATGDGLADLLLPMAILAVAPAGVIARIARAQLLEVLGQDYICVARAKGLTDFATLVRHALPNAMVTVLTVAGTLAGTAMTSTAVVEIVFNLPGLGRLAIFSVLARDYSLAAAVILVFVLAQVVISLTIDLLIVAVDPRSRDPMAGPP